MENKSKWISLSSKGLRHELTIAFGLVMLAVFVFLGYLFPNVSPVFQVKSNLLYVVVVALGIVILAFIWMRQVMVNPVIKISDEAKRIAEGDYEREIKLKSDDEIGELSVALNRMTSRIKENMEELKAYSEKTESINLEINKRILTLSSLMQVSNLISQNADLDEIIQVGMEKCLLTEKMNLGCLILKDKQTNEYLMKTIQGPQKDLLIGRGMGNLRVKLGGGVLGKAILKQEAVVIDRNTPQTSEISEFCQQFSIMGVIAVPIMARGKIHGMLMVGTDRNDYVCASADRELADILSKQIAIAIENTILSTKVEKLEIIDSLTGLFNSSFARQRLDEEIKRAISFQRPCAFVILAVDNFQKYHDAFGYIAAEKALIKIGALLKENIREVDKAARFGEHEFALILPERNKRQAIEIADEIRRKVEFIFSEEEDKLKQLTCTGVVTENPLDGISADELITKGRDILEATKTQGGNRISYKTYNN